MLRRVQDFAYMQPWKWGIVWGVLLAVLMTVLTDARLWEVLLYGVAFFLAIGFIRAWQGRRRRGQA